MLNRGFTTCVIHYSGRDWRLKYVASVNFLTQAFSKNGTHKSVIFFFFPNSGPNSNFSLGPVMALGLDNLKKKNQDLPALGSLISESSEIPAI